jgi:predicted nucleic acid-binding protein
MNKLFVFDTNSLISASLVEGTTTATAMDRAVILFFSPDESITACRDSKDNKFLELAVAANASCIITGDKDLLALNPFRGIPILNAVDFMNNF